jgi:hypothetical protein
MAEVFEIKDSVKRNLTLADMNHELFSGLTRRIDVLIKNLATDVQLSAAVKTAPPG